MKGTLLDGADGYSCLAYLYSLLFGLGGAEDNEF
tara:strand:- start:377 stop:478 length:102 start_codon:yes stop_codon:yes gene_type:complete